MIAARMPPPHALFVTDLDGTLLAEDARMPPRNLEAMRRAHALGVALAVVTGRRRSTVLRETPRLEGLPCRIAASNGAVVLGEDHTTIEACLELDWAGAATLAGLPALAHARMHCITLPPADAGDEPPETFVLSPHERAWFHSHAPWKPETYLPAQPALARARPLLHVALVLATRDEAERAEPLVREAFGHTVAVHTVQVPYGEGALLEAVPRGGKGNAVRHLVARLGLRHEATGAIGDDMNDADLLDAVRHRYAVGGSLLAARRQDAVEVAPARAGAVADALERFCAEVDRNDARGVSSCA